MRQEMISSLWSIDCCLLTLYPNDQSPGIDICCCLYMAAWLYWLYGVLRITLMYINRQRKHHLQTVETFEILIHLEHNLKAERWGMMLLLFWEICRRRYLTKRTHGDDSAQWHWYLSQPNRKISWVFTFVIMDYIIPSSYEPQRRAWRTQKLPGKKKVAGFRLSNFPGSLLLSMIFGRFAGFYLKLVKDAKKNLVSHCKSPECYVALRGIRDSVVEKWSVWLSIMRYLRAKKIDRNVRNCGILLQNRHLAYNSVCRFPISLWIDKTKEKGTATQIKWRCITAGLWRKQIGIFSGMGGKASAH